MSRVQKMQSPLKNFQTQSGGGDKHALCGNPPPNPTHLSPYYGNGHSYSHGCNLGWGPGAGGAGVGAVGCMQGCDRTPNPDDRNPNPIPRFWGGSGDQAFEAESLGAGYAVSPSFPRVSDCESKFKLESASSTAPSTPNPTHLSPYYGNGHSCHGYNLGWGPGAGGAGVVAVGCMQGCDGTPNPYDWNPNPTPRFWGGSGDQAFEAETLGGGYAISPSFIPPISNCESKFKKLESASTTAPSNVEVPSRDFFFSRVAYLEAARAFYSAQVAAADSTHSSATASDVAASNASEPSDASFKRNRSYANAMMLGELWDMWRGFEKMWARREGEICRFNLKRYGNPDFEAQVVESQLNKSRFKACEMREKYMEVICTACEIFSW